MHHLNYILFTQKSFILYQRETLHYPTFSSLPTSLSWKCFLFSEQLCLLQYMEGATGKRGKYSESVGKKVCITESEERNSFTEIWLAQQTYSVRFSASMSAQSSIPTSCFLLRGWEKGETSWEQTKRCQQKDCWQGSISWERAVVAANI